ncbi:hypothetical protein ACIBQ1_38255 [Nonomuraea sp. NPDC050153]|uniref:hypothetical protein n=1 Tax=Nonomuraea sp. NPDC050153 TaxID=3364359 RepID=UPI0037B94901
MLAAIGTVLAGLMSVPAIIISLNALKTTNQQRVDDLKQHEEERQQQAREKVERAKLQKTAFARNIIIWRVEALPGEYDGWNFRNHNVRPIYLYQDWTPSNSTRTRYYRYRLDPCSQGTIPKPTAGGGWTWVAAEDDFATFGYMLNQDGLSDDSTKLVNISKWMTSDRYTIGDVTHTSHGIRPCN